MKRRSAKLAAMATALSLLALGAFAQDTPKTSDDTTTPKSSDDTTKKSSDNTSKKTSAKAKKSDDTTKKTTTAKDNKALKPHDNPDQIGSRDVGSGINFYGLDTEIAMGKQLAQAVERDAKVVDDPIVAEYASRDRE